MCDLWTSSRRRCCFPSRPCVFMNLIHLTVYSKNMSRLIQPFGEALTMSLTGQLMCQVSDTWPPLWIMSGGTTSPAALAKVRNVDVSPCSLGTVQYWGTPVSPITSSSLGTSWHPLSLQFQICWGLTMFRSDSTCSN